MAIKAAASVTSVGTDGEEGLYIHVAVVSGANQSHTTLGPYPQSNAATVNAERIRDDVKQFTIDAWETAWTTGDEVQIYGAPADFGTT